MVKKLASAKVHWEVKATKLSPSKVFFVKKKPVLSAGVCHSCHRQVGVGEGIAVSVESIGYRGLPVVKYFHSQAAGYHAQHQQQQEVHHPAH
jgi:hypothetical protein